jgi:glyoxylase-like metal-dependent hydrolase (beta-lactamase superfamily II)
MIEHTTVIPSGRREETNVFFHYCARGFSNCYIVGRQLEAPADSTMPPEREAIVIDPGSMDEVLLKYIEKGEYNLKGVLITHNHENHVRGVRTLMRIYNTPIYAMQPSIYEYKTNIVHDEGVFWVGSFEIAAISVPGHSADSLVYKIGRFLFSGDTISAGMLGATPSSYGSMRQIAKIQKSIFPLQGDFVIFPGHGPPSTLNVERQYNASVEYFHKNKTKLDRMRFNLSLLT